MGKVAILSDSTCDLSPELVEKYGVTVVPLYVVLDGKPYKDGLEITPDRVYGYVAEKGVLPKTSAISVSDHEELFRPFAEAGREVVYFTISQSMSATYANAVMAAKEFPGVRVIDSANLSTGIGLQVLRAAELARAGKSANEICEYIEEMKRRVDTSFVIDTVDYLYKGGRCSGLAALGANMLKLHPLIEVKDGAMEPGRKFRGRMDKVLPEYVEWRLSSGEFETDRIFITHSGCPEESIAAVKSVVEKAGNFKEILVTRAGCTVSVHCGYGTLGVLFVRKR